MEFILLYLGIDIVVAGGFYALFGLLAGRYNKRIKEGVLRLNNPTHAACVPQIETNVKKAYHVYSIRFHLGSLAVLGAIVLVAFLIYLMQAPGEGITMLIFFLIFGGLYYLPAIIFCYFTTAHLFGVIGKVRAMQTALDEVDAQYKKSNVIAEIKESIRLRPSEFGVSTLSFMAGVAAVVMGVGVIAIVYISTQAAIDCARSSKCI